MEAVERDVLAAYKAECDADPEGAFAPYYHSIARAAGNNADLAYAACKSLKKAGLLTCGSARQGSNLLNAPSYWVTEKAEAAQRNYSIAVDFDGVIHSYTSKWVSADVIPDPPVPGAIDWLNGISGRFQVIIFTTRGKTHEGRWAVKKWLTLNGLRLHHDDYEVTAEKPPALIYLDDRAVRFDGTNFPTADQIHREFVPWNKRRAG